MKRCFLFLLILSALNASAQKKGTFTYTMNITSGQGGTVTANEPQPYTKYTDYSTYWFVKPDGSRYLFINGGQNLGIVILRSHSDDTTITYQDKFRGDQLLLQGKYNGAGFSCHPDNDKEPVHLHYKTFTAGEVELTFSGPVTFAISTSTYLKGNINGTIHLYRDAAYEKSAVAPRCNCDPNIYAYLYNPEIGRTPSACENAALWRVYNALHPALYPLLALSYTGKSMAPAGSILYRQDKSMVDVTETVETVNACDQGNKSRDVVSVNSHTHLFQQSDYKMGFIRTVSIDQFGGKNFDAKDYMKKVVVVQDSVMKLVKTSQMSYADAAKLLDKRLKEMKGAQNMPDIKQAEVYNHLDVSAAINVQHPGIRIDNDSEIQHNVPGAAFEIYKKSVKSGDGVWSPFKRLVFFGKFNIVKQADHTSTIVPVYDSGANKLSIFNAVITISGGQDLVEQATGTINFSSVPQMFD